MSSDTTCRSSHHLCLTGAIVCREAGHFIQLLRHRGHLAMQSTASQEEIDAMAQDLAALYDNWYKARQELVRMELVLSAPPAPPQYPA